MDTPHPTIQCGPARGRANAVRVVPPPTIPLPQRHAADPTGPPASDARRFVHAQRSAGAGRPATAALPTPSPTLFRQPALAERTLFSSVINPHVIWWNGFQSTKLSAVDKCKDLLQVLVGLVIVLFFFVSGFLFLPHQTVKNWDNFPVVYCGGREKRARRADGVLGIPLLRYFSVISNVSKEATAWR